MKELKFLLDYFKQYFDFCGATDWEVGFRCGAFFAISTILFLVILMFLFRFIFFRKRQIRQIVLDGEKGKYVVSSAAIADLLAAKIAEFSEVSLLKMKVFPAPKKKCRIVMHLNYLPGESAQNLKDLITRLQAESLAVLGDVFGITDVESVSICVSRAKRKK